MKLIVTSEEMLIVLRNGIDVELNGSGAYYPSKFDRAYGETDSYVITLEPYTAEQQADRLYNSLHVQDALRYTVGPDAPPEPQDNLFEDVKMSKLDVENL